MIDLFPIKVILNLRYKIIKICSRRMVRLPSNYSTVEVINIYLRYNRVVVSETKSHNRILTLNKRPKNKTSRS